MICICCHVEREIKDFFGEKCFKCVFKEKSKDVKKPENACKMCGDNIPDYRKKYCSKKCLDMSTKEKKKAYWVKHIKVVKWSWNR